MIEEKDFDIDSFLEDFKDKSAEQSTEDQEKRNVLSKEAKTNIKNSLLEKLKAVKTIMIDNYNAEAEIEKRIRDIKERVDNNEKSRQILLKEIAEGVKTLGENVSFSGIGRAAFRKMPLAFNIPDEKELIGFCMAHGFAQYIEVIEKIKKGELKAAIELVKGKPMLENADLTGFVEFTKQPDSFQWKITM